MDVQRTGGVEGWGGAPVPACQACKPAPLPGRFDAPSQHCPPRFRIVSENLIRTSINSWGNPSARAFCCLEKSNKRRDAVQQMLREGMLNLSAYRRFFSFLFSFLKGGAPGCPAFLRNQRPWARLPRWFAYQRTSSSDAGLLPAQRSGKDLLLCSWPFHFRWAVKYGHGDVRGKIKSSKPGKQLLLSVFCPYVDHRQSIC